MIGSPDISGIFENWPHVYVTLSRQRNGNFERLPRILHAPMTQFFQKHLSAHREQTRHPACTHDMIFFKSIYPYFGNKLADPCALQGTDDTISFKNIYPYFGNNSLIPVSCTPPIKHYFFKIASTRTSGTNSLIPVILHRVKSACSEWSTKLYSSGTTTEGTCSTAVSPELYHSSPTGWLAV